MFHYRILTELPLFKFRFDSTRKLNIQIKKIASMRNINSLSEIEKKELFDSLDTVLTDCDGVVWLENKPIPSAPDVINKLKTVGKNIFFVTNNSTITREDLLKKSQRLGFDVTINEMISSSWLSATYLKSINYNKKVYVIGSKAISKELGNVGIESFGYGPDPFLGASLSKDSHVYETDVGAVVVGHDIHFSYSKMMKACNYLGDPKCLFIATNTDPSFPLPGKRVAPGAGSFVKAIETCTGRTPVITGKPSSFAGDALLNSKGLDPSRALMIGDRCSTDIAFGNECSFKTCLVLTGIDNLENVEIYKKNNENNLLPTYYADSIADLLKLIEAGYEK